MTNGTNGLNDKQRRMSDNIDRLKKELVALTEKLDKFTTQHTYYYMCVQGINELSAKILLQGIEVNRKKIVIFDKRSTDK